MERTIRGLICAGLFFASAQAVFAQGITIDTNDVKERFVIGRTITTWNDSITTSADIGAPGASSWDFSGLQQSGDPMLLKSVAPATSPYIGQFPTATHVMEVSLKIAFFYQGLGDVLLTGTGYDHLALGTDLLDFGLVGSGTANALGASFPASGQWLNSPSAIFYGLPMTVGKTWTTSYTETLSGTAKVPIFGDMNFGPQVTNHDITYLVDGYGPLTLPGALTQDAIRIQKMDRYQQGTNPWSLRVSYIFVAKNAASVQVTVTDTTAAPSGIVPVTSVQWTTPMPVDVRTTAGVPATFGLEQNYPNPFNPTTVVSYQLPAPSSVRLVVYDMLGREVSLLVDENKPAGEYRVVFSGSGLASGIYYYRLTASSNDRMFVETKSMVLVK